MIENEKIIEADKHISETISSLIGTSWLREFKTWMKAYDTPLEDIENPNIVTNWHQARWLIGEYLRYSGQSRDNYDLYCCMKMMGWFGNTLDLTTPADVEKNSICNLDFHSQIRAVRSKLKSENFHKTFVDVKNQKLDYEELIKTCKTDIRKENPKYNIIVPVRNRDIHCGAFLTAMSRILSDKQDWCVTVIFQEDTDEAFQNLKNFNFNFNLNLIHLPHDNIRKNYGSNMNRSLCYNVVSKIVSCEWQINHDIDCFFTKEFLTNVEEKTKTDIPWLQPYRGSRVVYLNEETSNTVMQQLQNKKPIEFHVNFPPLNNTPQSPGAPGGSIVVRHKTFMEIGGYDPEYVWGYAPEDQLFWRKLEYHFLYENELDQFENTVVTMPFLRDDVFSHETNVELFHLWHPPTEVDAKCPMWSLFIPVYINSLSKEQIKTWLQDSKRKLA